jgi:hypothetical protein
VSGGLGANHILTQLCGYVQGVSIPRGSAPTNPVVHPHGIIMPRAQMQVVNPYESPSVSESGESHASSFKAPERQGLRFVKFSLCGGLAGFLLFCIIDVITVRVLPYPDRVHEFDWMLPLFPLVVAGCGAWYFRSGAKDRAWLIIGGLVLSLILAAGLVVLFGIPFHFAIGGQL